MGESILNSMGAGVFKAYSAGSHPTGRVNPYAIELLQRNGMSTEGLRSKNWEEFAAPGAPYLHFVFTVCDQAASEMCPVWPGQPMTAHWGIADPAAVDGTDEEKRKAFIAAYRILNRRISLFVSLPLNKLDGLALKRRLDEIGKLHEQGP
jgi:arsenate reductase